MLIYKQTKDIVSFLLKNRSKYPKIGFVPTMGALHSGHASLIKKSKTDNHLTICSIFINPSQFNQKEDFDKYPITTNADIELLTSFDCDILFLPTVSEIYPNGWNLESKIDLGNITTIWEGYYRPGHFDGVIQVVNLLLEIIQPNNLYLGQKDFQQCAVIKKLIAFKKYPINTIICETIREDDGLAMSSRNARLSITDRPKALILSKALFYIKNNFLTSSNHQLIEDATKLFNADDEIKLEYLCIVDKDSLEELEDKKENAIALVVAWVNQVRLIDNMILS